MNVLLTCEIEFHNEKLVLCSASRATGLLEIVNLLTLSRQIKSTLNLIFCLIIPLPFFLCWCTLLFFINSLCTTISILLRIFHVLQIDPTHYCLTFLENLRVLDTSHNLEGKLNARNLLITHKNELLLTVFLQHHTVSLFISIVISPIFMVY